MQLEKSEQFTHLEREQPTTESGSAVSEMARVSSNGPMDPHMKVNLKTIEQKAKENLPKLTVLFTRETISTMKLMAMESEHTTTGQFTLASLKTTL